MCFPFTENSVKWLCTGKSFGLVVWGIFYYISVADFACTEWFQSSTSGEDEGRDADISDGSQGEKICKHPCMLQQQQQKHHLRWSGGSSLHSRFHSLGTSTRHCVKRPPDRNSGWLMEKLDKILTSTPNRLQVCLFHSIFFSSSMFPFLVFPHKCCSCCSSFTPYSALLYFINGSSL